MQNKPSLPKLAEHDVTKMPFPQTFLYNFFSYNFGKDIKILLYKVLQVSRRYLQLFLSYRENSAEREEEAVPPTTGRMLVNPLVWGARLPPRK